MADSIFKAAKLGIRISRDKSTIIRVDYHILGLVVLWTQCAWTCLTKGILNKVGQFVGFQPPTGTAIRFLLSRLSLAACTFLGCNSISKTIYKNGPKSLSANVRKVGERKEAFVKNMPYTGCGHQPAQLKSWKSFLDAIKAKHGRHCHVPKGN